MKFVAFLFCCCLIFACNKTEKVEVDWSYIDIPTTSNIEQISFDNNGLGYFVGGDTWTLGIAGISKDGGQIWTVDSVCDKRLYDLYFDQSGVGYAAGIDGYLLTLESTEQWNFHRLGTYTPLRGIAFGPAGEGFTVSGNAFGAGIIQRFDENYQLIQTDSISQGLEDVVFSDESTIHVAGYGIVMRSTDAGLTWQRNEDVEGDFFQEIQFIDDRLGYMVGLRGAILKTIDAGANWQYLRKGKDWALSDSPFRAVYFLDANEGYIAGENGTLFFTDDAGDSWQRIENLPNENFMDIVIHEGNGYLAGENGVLIRFSLL